MIGSDKAEDMIERVTEIYVAVFPMPVSDDRMAEVILAGFKKNPENPNTSIVRATVETHVNAVDNLVALCDEIVDEQKEIASYRLLKFDQDGIHTLNPDDFRIFEQGFGNVRWNLC
ncbi:MAG: hypothetical protein HGJ94_18575 [Desulfosarcina sp.]|nr:hypothetical protein [Desulfosarcina sp.]MBC2717963.1 hypothetical protein [Desulfobacteraceae bacterium]MBC2758201.1 hypothetical protein [Desulfobacteraceae bacterium]